MDLIYEKESEVKIDGGGKRTVVALAKELLQRRRGAAVSARYIYVDGGACMRLVVAGWVDDGWWWVEREAEDGGYGGAGYQQTFWRGGGNSGEISIPPRHAGEFLEDEKGVCLASLDETCETWEVRLVIVETEREAEEQDELEVEEHAKEVIFAALLISARSSGNLVPVTTISTTAGKLTYMSIEEWKRRDGRYETQFEVWGLVVVLEWQVVMGFVFQRLRAWAAFLDLGLGWQWRCTWHVGGSGRAAGHGGWGWVLGSSGGGFGLGGDWMAGVNGVWVPPVAGFGWVVGSGLAETTFSAMPAPPLPGYAIMDIFKLRITSIIPTRNHFFGTLIVRHPFILPQIICSPTKANSAESLQEGAELLLTGPARCLSALDPIKVQFVDRPNIVPGPQATFYWDPNSETIHFDRPLYKTLHYKYGSVMMFYAVYSNGMGATVEVTLKNIMGKDSAHIYGSITAENNCTGSDCAVTLFSIKNSRQSVKVSSQQPIPLSRSEAVVPAYRSAVMAERGTGGEEALTTVSGAPTDIPRLRLAWPRLTVVRRHLLLRPR
ncbi:hypothetical protein RJ640_009234 [Escallonia rubra]|uniref:DUF6598 domain-containing protein n=1 Tax=Escallonia rubra TaxID=112253 RepID=A0AA88RH64_9ASTE|nr:hypothetical protein RJ640_009234 [Escallonia rubra]